MLLCVVPAAQCPPSFRLGVGCVSSPLLVRVLFFVVPAVTVECFPPLRIGVDGVMAPVLVRVLVCGVPAAECPPRFRVGVGGVSLHVLVHVFVCVAPASECSSRFRLGVGGVSSPVLGRVLSCVMPAVAVKATPPFRLGFGGRHRPSSWASCCAWCPRRSAPTFPTRCRWRVGGGARLSGV